MGERKSDYSSSEKESVPEAFAMSNGRPTRVENKIYQRAYQLYLARGGHCGHELEDWVQAEAEIIRASVGVARWH
jgi:Protein of unknown function (DUF2934)